jgi:hypothetical protein
VVCRGIHFFLSTILSEQRDFFSAEVKLLRNLSAAFSRALRAPAKIKGQSHLLQGFYHIPNQSSMVLIIADDER